ncbi:anhydro-N-acetylmuramic acid kinase [Microbacterium sp. G2-8]|uniref:anhydro-N-acetylmuramic acid kinase n=1 Tax=Microbacterium sp. G2-8 TaxID=2842454 RepID=UPI001C8A7ECE|nr:anhydro-N-acetylmuramic acid kinase [Microbacterium sp. G2-8]
MRVVAMQSGTSADGIDVATVEVGVRGTALDLHPVRLETVPWDPAVRDEILAAAHGSPRDALAWTRLDTELGQAFADAAAEAGPCDVVVSHGQTIHHWTEAGRTRGTLQLGEPSWIAERTGSPVVSHVRSQDVAAGGDGAPLMGVFDRLWAAGLGRDRVTTVNLGGIANVQIVAPEGVTAFDTGPANCLIDDVVQRATGRACDIDGALATAGSVDARTLETLLAHPYLAQLPPKSTGRETWNLDVVDHAAPPSLRLEDLVATLTAFTAETVARAVTGDLVVLSGGGVRNPALVRALRERIPQARVSDELGIDAEHKESLLFATLGALAWFRVPVRPGRAPARIAGRFTPGPRGLDLPPALPAIDAVRVAPFG